MAKNTNASNRGFAAMDAHKQREIASKGGKARSAQRGGNGTNHHISSINSGDTNRQKEDDLHHNS